MTNDQKKTVYAIQDEWQPKIMEAQRKVTQLQLQEKAALLQVLTAEQKALLIGEELKDKTPAKDKDKDKDK